MLKVSRRLLGAAEEGSGWYRLPEDCKELIYERLNPRDMARAARTCREFAAHIRGIRATQRSVVLPAGACNSVIICEITVNFNRHNTAQGSSFA